MLNVFKNNGSIKIGNRDYNFKVKINQLQGIPELL